MERAERLYYSVSDPVTELWIRKLNASAISLNGLYGREKDRRETYAEMTGTLVDAAREGLAVCAAFYGHPGVFVQPSHAAIRQLRAEGLSALMLPGVSTDGCLFADLGINPGDSGVQSFEATDFLLYRRRFDPTSGLILWQIGGARRIRAAAGTLPFRSASRGSPGRCSRTIRQRTRPCSTSRRRSPHIRRT